MVNPYNPSTREYILLNNLIECVETIQDYTNQCNSDGDKIDCKIINDLIASYRSIHKETLEE